MSYPKEITINWLKSQMPCAKQVSVFRETFGKKAKLNRSNLVIAASVGLDIEWLARLLLDATALQAYENAEAAEAASRAMGEATDRLRLDYEKVKASARSIYDEANAQAWRVYEEAEAHVAQGSEDVIAAALQAYEAVNVSAWLAYQEVEAMAWNALVEAKAAVLRTYEEARANALADLLGLD